MPFLYRSLCAQRSLPVASSRHPISRYILPLCRDWGACHTSDLAGYRQTSFPVSALTQYTVPKNNAKELAPKKIRVNALLPGLTKTKFAGALFEDEAIYSKAVKNIPMGRAAGPEEMAGAVLYFVSDASSFTTGACLICDGGRLI